MRRGLRRLAALALGGLLVLLLADALFWRIATEKLAAGFDAWMAGAAAEGLNVRAGSITRTGFPGAARLDVQNLALAPLSDAEGVRLSLPRLIVELRPEAPRTLHLRPEGALVLSVLGTSLFLEAGSAELTHLLAPEAPFVFTAERLALRSASAAPASLSLRHLAITVVPQPGDPPSLSLNGEGEGLRLPPAWQGEGGQSLTVHGEAALVPRPALDLADPQSSLEDFRAAHGHVAFHLRFTPEAESGGALALEGSFRLDARLLPEGEGTLHLTDPDAVIEGLVRAGVLDETAGRTLHALAALLVRRPPAGPPVLDLPLSARGGVLSVSGIPLFPLAP